MFRALQPVRYLSLLVARLQPVRATQIVMTGGGTSGAGADLGSSNGTVYRDVELKSFAAPRLRGRASAMADRAADILRFYGSVIGDCPYPTMTLALVEQGRQAADADGYFQTIVSEADRRRICGLPPTYLVLEAARPSSGRLLHYGRYVHPHGHESVSFASMAFEE